MRLGIHPSNRKLGDSKNLFLIILLIGMSFSPLATAEGFSPLDYSAPWDWPSADEVSNALFTARLLEEKGNGLLEGGGVAGAAAGGGSSGICSPGSTQTIFNCVITVSTTQIEGSQLTNSPTDNTNTVTDPSQSINDSSNNIETTP